MLCAAWKGLKIIEEQTLTAKGEKGRACGAFNQKEFLEALLRGNPPQVIVRANQCVRPWGGDKINQV